MEQTQSKNNNHLLTAHIVEAKSVRHFREIIEQNDFVIVDFWAEWCAPCHEQFNMFLEAAPQISRSYPSLTICKVNIDDLPQLRQEFKLRVVPELHIYKRGKLKARHEGMTPVEDLLKHKRTIHQELILALVLILGGVCLIYLVLSGLYL